MKRISILLIIVTLIAWMVGCGQLAYEATIDSTDTTVNQLDFECTTATLSSYETPPSNDKIEMMLIDSPPTPPINVSRTTVNIEHMSASAVTLSDVPTSTWTYGCTATSAGMLFGYYDRTGYPNMYTGPTNGGVCPLINLGQGIYTPIPGSCYIIATENGLDGISSNAHVDDYWISIDSAGPDPWEGNWPEHTWELCTADFLGTNQWKWDYDSYPGTDGVIDYNTDGSTAVWTIADGSKLYDWYPGPLYGTPTTSCCHGMRLFAESRGYTVDTNYNQLTDNQNLNGFTFAEFQAEIDAGCPVLVHVVGHTMVGIGYDAATNTIYIHDTWDNLVHSMTWGGSYAGRTLRSVTVIHLATPDEYSLTISSTSGGSVTTPGEGVFTYTYGTPVQLTATADPGWTFSAWSGDLTGSTNPDTVTMDSDKTVTATFTQDQYTLTVNTVGSGSVSKNPDQATYTYGTPVQLTATADPGWTFSGWSGDLTGSTNPDTITMDSDRTVTATFTEDQYTLTVNTVGSGSVSKNPDQATYTYGTPVQLTATADPGWTFSAWSGDLTGSTNPDTITMDGDRTVTATFTEDQYTLTVNTVGSGSVSKNPDQPTYTYGQSVELTATADPGWTFSAWSGDLTGSTNPDTITMNGDRTVTATFTPDQYTLTVNTVGDGSVTKNPDQPTYTYGQSVELTATADPGWSFSAWSGDLSSNTNPDTITMDGNSTVTATFTPDQYTLTVNTVGDGSVSKNPDQATYTYGTPVQLTATADPGWTFSAWSGDLTGNTNPDTITMDGDYSITANFALENTPPEVSSVSATQRSDGSGIVDISYDVSDNEQSTVDVSLEYWDPSGSWHSCTNTAGDVGPGINTGTGKAATWDAKSQFGAAYISGCKVRVTADDGAGGTDSEESNTFDLDTAPPTGYGCASPEDEAECVSIYEALVCSTASDNSAPVEYKFAIASDVAFSQDLQESGWQESTNWTPTTALSYGTAYWWRVKARDAKNNESEWSSPFTFVTIYKFDLALKSGWNMISLPLESCTGETDPSVILPDVEAIYTWNCETASYDSPSEIVPGKGYWALVFEDVTETIYGTPLEEYQLSSDCEGWHMVGALYVDGQVNVGSGSVYGSLYHWNPETLSYVARPLDDARPGEGYWLLAFTDFSISVVPKPPVP